MSVCSSVCAHSHATDKLCVCVHVELLHLQVTCNMVNMLFLHVAVMWKCHKETPPWSYTVP